MDNTDSTRPSDSSKDDKQSTSNIIEVEVGSQEDSDVDSVSGGGRSALEVSSGEESVNNGESKSDDSPSLSANAISGADSGGGTSKKPGYFTHYLKRMSRQERRRIEQEIIKGLKPGELIS